MYQDRDAEMAKYYRRHSRIYMKPFRNEVDKVLARACLEAATTSAA